MWSRIRSHLAKILQSKKSTSDVASNVVNISDRLLSKRELKLLIADCERQRYTYAVNGNARDAANALRKKSYYQKLLEKKK